MFFGKKRKNRKIEKIENFQIWIFGQILKIFEIFWFFVRFSKFDISAIFKWICEISKSKLFTIISGFITFLDDLFMILLLLLMFWKVEAPLVTKRSMFIYEICFRPGRMTDNTLPPRRPQCPAGMILVAPQALLREQPKTIEKRRWPSECRRFKTGS